MKNILRLLGIIVLGFVFLSCPDPLTGTSTGGKGGTSPKNPTTGGKDGTSPASPTTGGKDGTSPTSPVINDVFTVANLTQWNEAVTTISNSGNNKGYSINITNNFSVPASTNNTFGSVTGVNIIISGNHTITLQPDTKGNLLLIPGDQTVFIKDLKLAGHSNNNDSLVKVMGTFTMQGSASVSGNTNANGNGGGVYIENGSSFVMNDYSAVSGNTANKGGGLYINADSNVEIWGGSVYGNDNTVIPALRNTAVTGAAFYITDGSDSFYFDESITQEPNDVTFEDITANDGSSTENTTELTLSFSREIPGITAGDITLSGVSGANNITKTLSGSGPTYTLTIDNVTAGGNLTVTVQKPDFNISPASMSAEITAASIFNVANLAQWNNAKSAIANGGSNRSYTINVTDNFSIPGSTDHTFGSVTDVNVVICGNHTLTLQAGTQGHLLKIGANQSVVIQDINLVGHTSNNVELVNVGGSFIMQGSAVISNNTTNSDPSRGGGVYVGDQSTFTMYGNTSVTGNTAERGGGVCVGEGTFTMYDNSIISGNNASSSGGGVYVIYRGTFTMRNNASLKNNASGGSGGGVYVIGGFTMYDNSIISGNIASFFGGGVHFSDFFDLTKPYFRFAGGTVYGCEGSVLPANRNTALYGGASMFLDILFPNTPNTGTYGGSDGTAFPFYSFISEETITITGNVVTPIFTPTTPINVRILERTPATATISWNAVSYTTDYSVYRSTSPSGSFSLVGTTSSTQFTDGPLSTSTTYYYRVSARNNFGVSEKSSAISVPVKAIDYLIATPLSTNSIVIEWPVESSVNFTIGITNAINLLAKYLYTRIAPEISVAYILEYQDVFNNWIRLGKNVIPTKHGIPTGPGKHYFVDKDLGPGPGLHRYRLFMEGKVKLLGITIFTRRSELCQVSVYANYY